MFLLSRHFSKRLHRPLLLVLCLGAIWLPAMAQPASDTASRRPAPYFQPLKWRCIGPYRGGRSVAVCGVKDQPQTYYMGTTGGGLWKTDDMGITWSNISDGFFSTGSVGAVVVAESDPNIVYTGMGEHAIRGVMTHHGDGVYRSTDGGQTWKHTGLEKTQHIARIIVHPSDPDIAWVAAQGALYSASPDRGIYKTTDGGLTWKKVLFVNDKTGCAEISIDPNNPRILYAAMWEHGRLPWKVISGGPGSGLYKSTDGGENWFKLTEGLPTEMGKMAIAVCPSLPKKVYALIESDSEKEAGGLFVSSDAGESWSRVSHDHRLVQRAWYYIELYVHPQNENTIYVLSAPELRSIDGGRTWEDVSATHGDYHDLWINPRNPHNRAIADDGGVAITFNDGKTWSSQENMPTAQIYRINVDNQFPYRIYGGQQDNSSVSIAHREFAGGSISTESWTWSAGGECAFLAFDPDAPRYVMGGSYQGTVEILDTRSRTGIPVMAAPIQYLGRDAKDMKYRFNWNAPIIWSHHEPGVFYHCAQQVLRTADMGRTWTEFSPDLTRNEKEKQGKGGGPYTNEAVGAENYGTIAYIVESPHEKGVFWTGSDDGWVHLTTDGGKNWRNVTPPGLAECLVNAIEISPHDKGTAYIATTRYKFNDHSPGIYKTTDYGKTWTKITSGIAGNAFTRVVREDPVRRDLLFAGTELGLYLSWNGGKEWSPFQLNLPVTPITDLRIHQGDLIAATSGRSFWILDDLGLLRQFRKEPNELTLFQPEAAYLAPGSSELDHTDAEFTGAEVRAGVNPANGIVFYYHVPDDKVSDSLVLEITDADGQTVRTFSSRPDSTYKKWDGGPPEEPVLDAGPGLHRFVWDMRYPTMTGIEGVYIEAGYRGHKAIPGSYTAVLKRGDQTVRTTAQILPNPLYPVDQDTYRAYHEMMFDMEEKVREMHHWVDHLFVMRQRLEQLLSTLPDEPGFADIQQQGVDLIQKMKIWDEEMVQRKSKAYDDVENFPNRFTADYLFLINLSESLIPRVNPSSLDLKKEMDAEWFDRKERAAAMLIREIPAFNQRLWAAGIGAIWEE